MSRKKDANKYWIYGEDAALAAQFTAYLATVLKNRRLTYIRHLKKIQKVECSYEYAAETIEHVDSIREESLESAVEAKLMWEAIKPYLHKLSPKECEVMICLYIDRLSIVDTATKLKIKPDTVSTHKHNDAIADSKYLLRKNHVTVEVEDDGKIAYMDDKWVRFILNQIISNAVKYRTEQPSLRFSTAQKHNQVILSVEDNGIGIPQSDLPRVFEKGFTGQNGRTVHSSTGIGLYLCKRLCDKLGIGLSVCSQGNGTSVSLIFPINDFVAGVQG